MTLNAILGLAKPCLRVRGLAGQARHRRLHDPAQPELCARKRGAPRQQSGLPGNLWKGN